MTAVADNWSVTIWPDGTRHCSRVRSLRRRGRPAGVRLEVVDVEPAVPLIGHDPFRAAAADLLERYRCEVVGWTEAGVGSATNLLPVRAIRCPPLIDDISLKILAHEIAHHELHHTCRPALWIQEFEAEQWAIARLDEYFASAAVRQHSESYVVGHMVRSLGKSSDAPALAQRMLDRLPESYTQESRDAIRYNGAFYRRR